MTFLCNTKIRPLQPEITYTFMETIYLCIIIFLFVLAVFDLMVGVGNDAVNFLNSAVGAKAASFKNNIVHCRCRYLHRSVLIKRYDGHRKTRHLPTGTFLFRRNHVHPACRNADRRRSARCIQLYGNAYLDHCFNGIRTFGRYFCPGTYQSTQQ